MKTNLSRKTLALALLVGLAATPTLANEPDEVYLFSYATTLNKGQNGLHFAWSNDRAHWQEIGPEFSFVKCDYGRWGEQKRMLHPVLGQLPDGSWCCYWNVNETEPYIAEAVTPNLVDWKPQAYHTATELKSYATRREAFLKQAKDTVITLSSGQWHGQLHKTTFAQVRQLENKVKLSAYEARLNNERIVDDATRFAALKPYKLTVTPQPEQTKAISPELLGIFFEDINYSADGGLYAELVQNRDFEYAPSDKNGHDTQWHAQTAWQVKGDATWQIATDQPIHPNNPHYAALTTTGSGTLVNSGYDGIAVKQGARYDVSLFAKQLKGKNGKLGIRLVNAQGKVIAQTQLSAPKGTWKQTTAVLTAAATEPNATLEVVATGNGTVGLDMISLFPQDTFRGRKNGLRKDLAQTLADLHPRFIRFPGGCVSHGDGLDNIYRWKTTIGKLEARKPMRNLWNYHQTTGLGYYEYFQFCEDIGAAPLPVIAAAVPCQNSACGVHGGGQQGGIPMEQMEAYIQDIVDLVEWANGDAKKTVWGAKRAAQGHPKPFHLKYIGIGNEDLISDVFAERYRMIVKEVTKRCPGIVICGTVGPFNEGSDYEEGWRLAKELQLPMVDEHYYQTPGWFINHQDFYDRYDRTQSKVYLGEYAAHIPGRANTLETALAEALHLINVERNGDVVSMTSYAPLLAKEGHTQWNPDLIYFNNTEVKPTVGYQVQKLFGQYLSNHYVPVSADKSTLPAEARKRVAVSVVNADGHGTVIKVVNMLPVEAQIEVKLPGVNTTATGYTLSGNPESKTALPVEGTCEVHDALQQTVPAYSFTLYKIND